MEDALDPTAMDGVPAEADEHEPGPTIAPFGSWSSPIRVEDLVVDVVRLAEPWVDGDDVYWLEGRPAEAGRRVLVRASRDGTTVDLTPAPYNVRTHVHEYGGGSYVVAGGTVVFSHFADGRLYRLDPGDETPVAITPEGPYHYADLRSDPRRRRFLAVREDHGAEDEPEAAIVAIDLDGAHDPQVLADGPDFLSSPRLSPDGATLAWLEWDHPDMPWDATRLRTAPVAEDGSLGPTELVAGGPEESIVQPEWSPDGVLHLISDRTGWWNLYRWLDGPRLEPLAPMEAEFADPAWIFDRSSYGFLPDGSIVADRPGRGPRPDLPRATGAAGRRGRVGVHGTRRPPRRRRPGGRAGRIAGRGRDGHGVRSDDPGAVRRPAPIGVVRVRPGRDLHPGADRLRARRTGGSRTPSTTRPANPAFAGPADEKPPLVVRSHGGPTSNASTALDLGVQLLTSRGIAVVDVDYGGSTGYGRAYRKALDGAWGVVDVDDCIAAARFLVDRGDVDPERLAIEGGSAGGYTTLAALAFRDVFAAGISWFGVGDLESLTRDSHKFESRYNDRLVGPYPEAAALYRERSPVHFLDRIACPVLVLQGLDDKVVPPNQAEAIVAALEANGIPHAYLAFEGEGHGFRGATAIRASLEAELSFLGAVFGFAPADDSSR